MKKSFELNEEEAIELGKYLKNRREELGYSTNYVEIQSGINKADLSRIESGKKKKVNPLYLKELSKVLKINQIELFKIAGFIDDRAEIKGNARILSKQEEQLATIELPVYGKASAGNGYINFEEVIRVEKITNIPGVDLPKGSFIIEVGGDSMAPTLLDGDLAIVKPVVDCEETDGKICVVTWNDQTFIKRVRYQKGMVILMSDNPDRNKYHDIFIEKDELQYLKCHGIVVESRRKY